MTHTDEEEIQPDGEPAGDPAEAGPPRPWGRLLIAGAIGAALALMGIAADAFL